MRSGRFAYLGAHTPSYSEFRVSQWDFYERILLGMLRCVYEEVSVDAGRIYGS